jgi:hypothetical protein
MSLSARKLRSAGKRITTAKCLILLFFSMQVSAMFSPKHMGSLASIAKDIPKLTDTNYEEWSFRVKCIFMTLGLGATLYPHLPEVLDGRMLFNGQDVSITSELKADGDEDALVTETSTTSVGSSSSSSSSLSSSGDSKSDKPTPEVLLYAYNILVHSLSSKFIRLIRHVPHGNVQASTTSVLDYNNVAESGCPMQ